MFPALPTPVPHPGAVFAGRLFCTHPEDIDDPGATGNEEAGVDPLDLTPDPSLTDDPFPGDDAHLLWHNYRRDAGQAEFTSRLTDSPEMLFVMGRVLATLGDRADTGSWLADTAVTVIAAPPGLVEPVVRALNRLAPDRVRPVGASFALRLSDSDPVRTRHATFARKIRRALGNREPVALVIGSPADLEPALRAVLPDPLPLAPLDGEILRDVLAVIFPDDPPAPALPDAGALSRLDDDALLMALRAPTAEAAASAIADRLLHSAPAAPTAPGLDAIAGYGEAEAMARRLVDDLNRWRQGEIAWSDMTRSVLFEGGPGTGKTFLARAIGASAGVPFHATSLADWQAAGHLGDMLREMQASFAAVRAQTPAILFVDEIDSLGSRWSRDRHAENYRRQVINAFLAEIDGTRAMEGVILIGATNDAGMIDPAVLRPGRFDRIVRVPNPGPEAIRRILAHHLGDAIPPEDRERLVPHAAGLTAAGIDGAIREARSRARAAGHAFGIADLDAVIIQPHLPTQERLWRVAVHEAGHMLAGLQAGGMPRRAVASPHEGLVDFDWPAPPATRAEIEAHLTLKLAGRTAEEIILGEVSAGCGGPEESDLAQATRLALNLELRTGLGGSTLLWHRDPDAALNADPELRARIARHLDAARDRARALIEANFSPVIDFADVLLNLRILEGEELEAALRRVGMWKG